MAEFAYNNVKNLNIGYMSIELNSSYYFCIQFKQDTNFCSQLKIADKLLIKL